MAFAVGFKDGILCFSLLDILAYSVVVILFRAGYTTCAGLHDLNTYTTGFHFADIVLVLDLVTDNDVCGL